MPIHDLCFHASSLPCLHTFWHAIPTSFYIFHVFYFFVYMIIIYHENSQLNRLVWGLLTLAPITHPCTRLYQNQCTFQKIHSLSTGGAHSRLLVHIASPTSPPYVGTQLTALFHTQPLLKCLVYSIASPMVNCAF